MRQFTSVEVRDALTKRLRVQEKENGENDGHNIQRDDYENFQDLKNGMSP